MKPVPKEGILDMPAYVGGRDAVKGVANPHKMSANENPLGDACEDPDEDELIGDEDNCHDVYNPEQEGQVSESGAWYEYFVQNNDLPDEACVVFAFAPNAQRGTRQRVSPKIEHLNVVNISLDDGSLVKTQFERFLKAAKARKDSGGGGGEAKGAEYK